MIREQRDEFLSELAGTATEPTVMSYRTTLDSFVDYCEADEIRKLTIGHVTAFISAESTDKAPATLQGEVSCLANFVAYCREDNPSKNRAAIYNELDQQGEFSRAEFLNPGVSHQIEDFISLLRTLEYGSRTHALVELFVATGCRINTVQQADIENYCDNTNSIELNVSKTHVVNKIHDNARKVPLSEEAAAAMEAYITHERYDCVEDGRHPLITTPYGRISTSTIRQSIRSKYKNLVSDTGANADEIPPAEIDGCHQASPITPHKLRRYWLNQQ